MIHNNELEEIIMEELITIGKLSKISGITPRTIRHYEDIGILLCAENTEAKYRLYSSKEIKKLELILLFESLGFSLTDIKAILSTNDNDTVANLFLRQYKVLSDKMEQVSRYKEMLSAVIKIYQTHGLEFVNNYHLLKEIVSMNSLFVKTFSNLDLKLQIRILMELYQTGSLTHDTLKEMGVESGQSLLKELHMSLVKNLLNSVDFEVEKNIMEHLISNDPDFAAETMKAMFTFDDIPKLDDETIRKWLEKCGDDDLTVALKDSSKYLKDKIFNNMDAKRANIIRDKIADSALVSLDEAFSSMSNLISILRKMESEGLIVIHRFKE